MKRLFLLVTALFLLVAQSRAVDYKGTYYVGNSGTKPGGGDPEFLTLRAACDSLSSATATFSGDCIFYITSSLDEACVASGLGLACNPAPYTVTFKPFTGISPVITINYLADANSGPSGQFVIGIPAKNNIAWADCKTTRNIVFDGSNTAGGKTRDMTIQSAAAGHRNSMGIVITADVQNLTIKNCNIYNQTQVVSTSGNLFISALLIRSTTTTNTVTEKTPANITIQNNHISSNFTGVPQNIMGLGFYAGGTITNYPAGVIISGNKIEGKRRAVSLYYAGSTDIYGNEIVLNQDIADGLTNEAICGFNSPVGSTFNIYNNKIASVSSKNSIAVTTGITAISLETNGAWNIYNNMISGFALSAASADKSAYVYGIKNSSATATANICNNTIQMDDLAGIGAGAVNYRGIFISNGTNTVMNNIIINQENDFASCNFYRLDTTGTVYSDYNDLSVTGTTAQVGYWKTAAAATLSAWKTASSQDAHSISKAVTFVSSSDLHLAGSSIGDLDLVGAALASIMTDFDGEARNPSYPYMGADERINAPLPVELTSFECLTEGLSVKLSWSTATELNCAKFTVERASKAGVWVKAGEVTASGNSGTARHYSFIDSKLGSGEYSYRLKITDYDGSYKYSKEINAVTIIPKDLALEQNYPNPFNPATVINYQLPSNGLTSLTVFDALGREVATLVNEFQNAGKHSVSFNANGLSSGIYFYRLNSNGQSLIKKMQLIK